MFVGFRVPVFVFLYVTVMSSITVEQLETILENKLEKALTPLSKQVQDAMDSIKFINAKYDEISKSLKAFDEEKKILMNENKLLKTEFLKTANELKTLSVFQRPRSVFKEGLPRDQRNTHIYRTGGDE